jgi:hypothetical protein
MLHKENKLTENSCVVFRIEWMVALKLWNSNALELLLVSLMNWSANFLPKKLGNWLTTIWIWSQRCSHKSFLFSTHPQCWFLNNFLKNHFQHNIINIWSVASIITYKPCFFWHGWNLNHIFYCFHDIVLTMQLTPS